MQEQATDVPVMSYAFRASLIGTAHRFELTEAGLSWRLAGRSGTWPYADISAVRLSFRPVWMQPHRFRADIGHKSGARLSIVSTSWQTAALMATQDNGYRDFIVALHQRMAAGGSTAELTGGLGRITYAAAVSLVTAVGLMLLGLFLRDRDRRIRRRVVFYRLCGAVRLADRRLCPPQPADDLFVRPFAARIIAVMWRRAPPNVAELQLDLLTNSTQD